MVTATATRSWRWHNYGLPYCFLFGGLTMLVAAIFVSSESVVPLLTFGASWLLVATLQAVTVRHLANEVSVDETDVLFSGPAIHRCVPVSDIVSVRRSSGDFQLVGSVRVRTRSHGVIKVAVRLDGARALSATLLAANDQLRVEKAWEDRRRRRLGRGQRPGTHTARHR
jgi:hypothetical protein